MFKYMIKNIKIISEIGFIFLISIIFKFYINGLFIIY